MTGAARRVAIRADASRTIGGGHVMRCLTLAHALAERGAEVLFVVNPGAAELVPGLAASGFGVAEVAPGAAPLVDAVAGTWADGADALVFDMYTMGRADHAAARAVARRIAVIDDLADRPHDCDILFDQTHGRGPAAYADLVPVGALRLVGAEHALLRPDFAALRPHSLARREEGAPVRRILISFGLLDIGGLSAVAARALCGRGFALDLVVGSGAPTLPDLRALEAACCDLTLHVDSDRVAALMAAADLALGAGGSTSWERCCLGLPSVLAVVADNQRAIAANLSAAGAAVLLEAVTETAITDAVTALAGDAESRIAMARTCAAICDGRGAARLAGAILAPAVTVRPATLEDARNVWVWRHAGDAVRFYRSGQTTPWPDHLDWFTRALGDPRRDLLICQAEGRAVGHVRFDAADGAPTERWVSLCVDPDARGDGLGARCLAAGCAHAAAGGAVRIHAHIHRENGASLAVFARCGFLDTGAREGEFGVFTLSQPGRAADGHRAQVTSTAN
ncbi:MAG: UDP-2,4-diacetamido-2,4,6-trideoxy-beta-L-altropyranose hydrolase [Rhodospirillaceae bacterium]|nr:UDP-2,4-diacetamido-2,4,6-trideoxy-beta-L-altropyranose hydrolase [Rhodospirillaceae bacterium]